MADENRFPGWFMTTIGILANIGGCFFFSSYTPRIIKAFTMRNIGTLTPIPIAFLFCNCLYWSTYGMFVSDYIIIVLNAVGLVFCIMYIGLFSASCADNKRVLLLVCFSMAVLLLWFILYTVHFYANIEFSKILGPCASAAALATFASPLVEIVNIIRRRSAASISLPTCIVGTFNTTMWTLYSFGKASIDYSMLIANCPGIALNLIQIILFIIYRKNTRRDLKSWREGHDHEHDMLANGSVSDEEERQADVEA